MRTIQLHIEDDLLTQSIDYLKYFVSHHKGSDFTYQDDLGDTIKVIDGVEYVIPSSEDKKSMAQCLDKSDFTSLEDLKKDLCIN
jgi:hypothetical protein